MNKIICIDTTLAIGAEKFIKLFLARLRAKNVNLKFFNPIQLTQNYFKLFDKKYSLTNQQFEFTFLNNYYSFLSEIIRQNTEDKFEKEKDTYYIIDNLPFLYNINPEFNKYANKLLLEFHFSLENINYIYLSSNTEHLIDEIDFRPQIYHSDVFKLINQCKTKEDRIISIEKTKDKFQESFLYLRKQGINCIKAPINYTEDINKLIEKIFDALQL